MFSGGSLRGGRCDLKLLLKQGVGVYAPSPRDPVRVPLPYEPWKVSQVIRCNRVRTRADVLLTLNGDDLDLRPAVPLAVIGLDNG